MDRDCFMLYILGDGGEALSSTGYGQDDRTLAGLDFAVAVAANPGRHIVLYEMLSGLVISEANRPPVVEAVPV